MLNGDQYIGKKTGKKRFITVGGEGTLYSVYCKRSESAEDLENQGHLNAYLVEKGTAGFSVEVIHDPMGRFSSRHAALNFTSWTGRRKFSDFAGGKGVS